MQPLSSAFQPFGATWWRELGERVVLETKKLADKGQGYGGKWPLYSTKRSLRMFNATGFDTYQERKAANDFPRQSSTQINPPNLELTGDMWNDFKVVNAEATGAEVGSIAHGLRAWGNEERGRAIFGEEGPAASVRRLIDAAVKRKMNEQLNRTQGVTVIRVGKR